MNAFYGGCDQKAYLWNLQTQQVEPIAQHNAPIKTVNPIPEISCVATGGWDNCFNLWDLRQARGTLASSAALPGKVYAADVKSMMIILCLANRQVLLYDSRNMAQPYRIHNPELSYQLRSVACFPDMQGFVTGSVEGKCEVAYLQPADQAKNFRFKCHVIDPVAFPVHRVVFHPIMTDVLATAGGDGAIYTWNLAQRKRVAQLVSLQNGAACTALSFSSNGNWLAYAAGYDWTRLQQGLSPGNPCLPPAHVFIKTLDSSHLQVPEHGGGSKHKQPSQPHHGKNNRRR